MKYRKCVLYEFCKNKIVEMTMSEKYIFGEEFMLFCGYTNEESHYIFLGDLEDQQKG